MEYCICTRCVMDTSVPDIIFDEKGVCQFCKDFEQRVRTELHDNPAGYARLESLMKKVRKKGAGKKYDCIIGVSGGVDSTYVAYLVKKRFGLRPLAVHLDNGWNSELAVANVEQVLKRLNIDLETYVLDWEEYKNLQVSFLKSSISNIEIPTDHAIWALLIRSAAKYKISYIMSGSNIVTEALMPESWLYGSKDSRLIVSIQRQFGTLPLRSYPKLNTAHFAYYLLLKGIKWVPILNYVHYVKNEVKKVLTQELGWRDYGGKHYESIYTRFFHAYYLPRKFGYDLRRSYLSALVVSGQMPREEALKELELPPAEEKTMEEDKEFVLKKLNMTEADFKSIMDAPRKTHADYANSDVLWRRLNAFVRAARNHVIKVE